MRLLPVAFLALLASLSFCHADDSKFVNVVGFVECADCEKSGTKTTQVFSGLHVTVECRAADGYVETSQAAELNEEGKFTVSIPQKLVKLSKECHAKLHSASMTPCSKLLINSYKDSNQDLSITGKLKFSKDTCESKFLWKHPLPPLPKLPLHPWKKSLPPFQLPPIPFVKKPCPPLFKPPTPAYIPPVVKPPPVPVYKPTPKPAPVPVYKPKPTPTPVPIYKPPPVPVYKPKPTPTPVPIYKPKPKPTPTSVPIYKPPPVPVYKPKPTPAPVPIYKPAPTPKIKKPCPPIVKPHPLPPLIPKIKKPFPPFPKIDPHKFFHHHKYGKIIPKIPHKFLKHPKLGKLPPFPIYSHH